MSSTPSNISLGVASGKGKDMLSIVLQVVVGVIATYALYVASLAVMNVDHLVIDEKYAVAKKKMVKVIDGYADASARNIRYNTTMPMANNYLPIRPSVNIKGGAQFTYSFWLYIDNGASVENKTIFLKGSDMNYTFDLVDNSNLKKPPLTKNEHLVFCPKVTFGTDASSFNVLFNTLNKHNEVLKVDKITSSDSIYRNNLLATLSKVWFMITITFEDNIPINDFENGIMVKFYVNDVIYKSGKYKSTLKQNPGDLILFPNGDNPITNVKLSNMKYFNYVLNESEIKNLLQQGASLAASTAYMPATLAKPPVLSDYNKLDIYNI